ncbi:TrkA family potassium uptake protein [bacterium]|nr:TrkA family potassium uptake protein [bacterium]
MQFLVIGLGTFGRKVALTLLENGAEVVAIDRDKNKVEIVKDKVTIAMVLDSTDEEAMHTARIEDVDAAVVALGNAQEEAILTTAILKRMGIFPIMARAANTLYEHVLKLVGADRVVIIEEQMGEYEAKRLLAPEIREKILLTTGHSLVELEARKEFIGKSLKELDIRNKFGVNVVSIQRKSTNVNDQGKVYESIEVNDLPGPDDTIQKGDILLIVGAEDDIERMAVTKEV